MKVSVMSQSPWLLAHVASGECWWLDALNPHRRRQRRQSVPSASCRGGYLRCFYADVRSKFAVGVLFFFRRWTKKQVFVQRRRCGVCSDSEKRRCNQSSHRDACRDCAPEQKQCGESASAYWRHLATRSTLSPNKHTHTYAHCYRYQVHPVIVYLRMRARHLVDLSTAGTPHLPSLDLTFSCKDIASFIIASPFNPM